MTKPKTCCDHDCDEGCACIVRKVRAGGPPPDDLPIQYAEDEAFGWWDIIIFMGIMAVMFGVVTMVFVEVV